jgi:hypothetical protein
MPNKHRKAKNELPVLHPDAAGVDIGAEEIFVAIPADRDALPVRRFPTFTGDLLEAAAWLKQCGIRTVAMESTSVYWIPLYQIWRRKASKCSWSTRSMSNMCLGGRQMSRIANGFSNSIQLDCCAAVFDQRARCLRIHVKNNIIYHMQAIRTYEPPDQRYFRLYDLDVPVFSHSTAVSAEPDQSARALIKTALNPGKSFIEVSNFSIPRIQEDVTMKLHQVADIDSLWG